MRKLLVFGLILSICGLAQTLPTMPNTASMAPILDDLGYSLPACPTPGASTGPGSTKSPADTQAVLQAALNAAAHGDVICVDTAGIATTGTVTFPAKTGTGWITVRTASGSLPSRRILKTDVGAAFMARIRQNAYTAGGAPPPVVLIANTAKGYRLVGLEITTDSPKYANTMVKIGVENSTTFYPSLERIHIDRCLIHGKQSTATTGLNTLANKGVSISGQQVGITNSSIWDFRGGSETPIGSAGDTNAIWVVNSLGKIIIQNNYLEASGENIIFGGVELPGTTEDVIVRGNYFDKQEQYRNNLDWYFHKNMYEHKNGDRVLVEGNYFSDYYGNPGEGQYLAIKIVASNQCKEPNRLNIRSNNITVRYNRLHRISEFIGVGQVPDFAACGRYTSGTTKILIEHNLVTELGWLATRPSQCCHAVVMEHNYPLPETGTNKKYHASHVTFQNNTIGSFGLDKNGNIPAYRWSVLWNSGTATALNYGHGRGFTFRNNVVPGNIFTPSSNTALSGSIWSSNWLQQEPPAVVTKNLGPATQAGITTRPPNYAPAASWATMFTNAASGNFTLTSAENCGGVACNSLLGTDGEVVGVNITALNSCVAGAETNWTGSCPGATNVGVSLTVNGSAGPVSIESAADAVFVWTSTNATSCTKTATPSDAGWTGTITGGTAASGTLTLNPTANTVYTLTCTGATGTNQASVAVNITGEDLPGPPTNLLPIDNAINVSLTPTLSWSAATFAETYDVYLSTSNPPATKVSSDQTTTTYTVPSALTVSTDYYWRVVAKNTTGSTNGPLRKFTTMAAALTAPDTPTYDSPADGAVDVPRPVTLSWNAAARADVYDIYVGTTNPPPLLVSDHSGISRTFATLPAGTLLYWKIVAKNSAGSTEAATVRSFTTRTEVTGCPATP